MDPTERVITEAWARSRFSPDALCTLRALIRTHEQRLQGLDPTTTTAAIVDAVYADVAADPALQAALRRATQRDVARKMQRAEQN
jgi:hypothetical protein